MYYFSYEGQWAGVGKLLADGARACNTATMIAILAAIRAINTVTTTTTTNTTTTTTTTTTATAAAAINYFDTSPLLWAIPTNFGRQQGWGWGWLRGSGALG